MQYPVNMTSKGSTVDFNKFKRVINTVIGISYSMAVFIFMLHQTPLLKYILVSPTCVKTSRKFDHKWIIIDFKSFRFPGK